jgi:hypothetical protein
MNSTCLHINSANRTSGNNNNFSINFIWPYYYSPSKIKVLNINVPGNSSQVYIVSDIIGGMDNGYLVPNSNLPGPLYSGLNGCVIGITNLPYYQANSADPYFISNGTYFSQKNPPPSSFRTLNFSIKNEFGNLVTVANNWSVTIECVFNL